MAGSLCTGFGRKLQKGLAPFAQALFRSGYDINVAMTSRTVEVSAWPDDHMQRDLWAPSSVCLVSWLSGLLLRNLF